MWNRRFFSDWGNGSSGDAGRARRSPRNEDPSRSRALVIAQLLGLRPPAREHVIGPLLQASIVVLSDHDNEFLPRERNSRGPPAVIVNAF